MDEWVSSFADWVKSGAGGFRLLKSLRARSAMQKGWVGCGLRAIWYFGNYVALFLCL